MVADHAPDRPEMTEQAELLTHLLGPADDRLEHLVVAQIEEDVPDLLVDGGGEQAERFGARLLGRERGVARVGGEHAVHARRDLAESAEPAEELLRRGGQLVERKVPAVDGVRDVLLEDPERRVERPPRIRVPPRKRRDVRKPMFGQEAEHLELGVDPRLEPAERLQDQLVVEDHRAVRLLARHDLGAFELAPERGKALDRAEVDDALLRPPRRARPDLVHELARQSRVREAVGEALLARARPGEHLVDVVRSLREADLDEEQRQLRRQVGRVDDARADHLARLGAEPALLDDVVDQRTLVDRGHAQSFLSWNQKNPRGPNVSR